MKNPLFWLIGTILSLLTVSCAPLQTVVLLADSSDWSVVIKYEPQGRAYIEIPSIKYLGNYKISQVEVQIHHAENSYTGNTITSDSISNGDYIELVTRSKRKDWGDTKSVKIIWFEDGQKREESIKARLVEDKQT